MDAQVFFQVVFVLEGFATFSAFKLSIPSSTWLSNMPLKNVRENALYLDEQYSCHLSVSVKYHIILTINHMPFIWNIYMIELFNKHSFLHFTVFSTL